jgi:hydroxymethylglutaryl-CoA reductase
MGIKSAADLAEVLVSVGLAQNLAALRALATEGIQRGHMTLHARQVAVAAGAQPGQIDALVERLIADKIIRIDHAIAILEDWNGGDRGQ